jgi:hypothetical protein
VQTRLICSRCALEAPTRDTVFRHNVGMFFLRHEVTTAGPLCKKCVHRCYWGHTAGNLVFGWWGLLSFWLTQVYLLSNTIRYLLCLTMPGVPAGARVPEFSADETARMEPFQAEVVCRLEAGEHPDALATEFGPKANLTPGQGIIYLDWLVSSGRYDAIRYAKYAENADPAQAAWW